MSKSDVGRFKDITKRMLEKHSNLRDNVGLLYVAVVAEIMGLEYVKGISLYEYFRDYKENFLDRPKLPSLGSILRLNTRLQKFHPELRGENWEENQRHSNDYKEDLGYGKKEED